jgi:hypothetical protein
LLFTAHDSRSAAYDPWTRGDTFQTPTLDAPLNMGATFTIAPLL